MNPAVHSLQKGISPSIVVFIFDVLLRAHHYLKGQKKIFLFQLVQSCLEFTFDLDFIFARV